MYKIINVTTNLIKLRIAANVCAPFGIELKRVSLDIDEIQAEGGHAIARAKAAEAFAQLQKPVVLSDDSWAIIGLKGFPGPYMKYVNQWFTADDWLRLTLPLTDRRIILQQWVAYHDSNEQKMFYTDVEGLLLSESKGSSRFPHMTITSFDDGKTSAAEAVVNYESAILNANKRTSWHDFAEWYSTNHES